MIEQIPNPLTDAGVKKDITQKVQEVLKYPGRYRSAQEHLEFLVRTAAEWGMATGFRMGWMVKENLGRK